MKAALAVNPPVSVLFDAGAAVGPGPGAPALLPPDGWGDDILSLGDLSGRLASWIPRSAGVGRRTHT